MIITAICIMTVSYTHLDVYKRQVLHTERTSVARYAKKVFSLAGIEGKIYVRGKEESRMYEFAVKEELQVQKLLLLFGHTGIEPSLRINSKNFCCEHCVQAVSYTHLVFGSGAIKMSEKIDLVVHLEPWDKTKNYSRTGLETETTEILGLPLPSTVIPVMPGRNLAVILEAAAINNRQKKMGYNAAQDLLERLGLENDVK